MAEKTVYVHHVQQNGNFHHVASIEVDPKMSDMEALEYAFRWTNNVEGSWSRPNLPNNSDANPAVRVIAKLPKVNGEVRGLRSSMMGDIFMVNDNIYLCAAIGWKPLETIVGGIH